MAVAGREPNVVLAMAMAGKVTAMDLAGWTHDRCTLRLADEAWQGYPGLRNSHTQRSVATGLQAVDTRARHEWCQKRSATGWGARSSWVFKLVVPLQKVVRPWRH